MIPKSMLLFKNGLAHIGNYNLNMNIYFT